MKFNASARFNKKAFNSEKLIETKLTAMQTDVAVLKGTKR